MFTWINLYLRLSQHSFGQKCVKPFLGLRFGNHMQINMFNAIRARRTITAEIEDIGGRFWLVD